MTQFEKVFERSKRTIADLRAQIRKVYSERDSLVRENTKLSTLIAELKPISLDRGSQRALQALEDSLDGEEDTPPSVTKAIAAKRRKR